MSKAFDSYEEAKAYAQCMADASGCQDYGIERVDWLSGREDYVVRMLPRPENSYGYELRCERVRPTKPRT